jgi:hypothetical protein
MGFFGVACVASSDCWAVGFAFIGGGGTRGPLAEHWNGSAWSIIATDNPSFVNNQLSGVTCIGTSDCWAVGFALTGNLDQTSQTFADHWNGSAWTIVTTPNTSSLQTNQLGGVSCSSSSDCWAVGFGDVVAGVPQTLAEHWDGAAWAIAPTPNTDTTEQNVLSDVSCSGPSDCWAVGFGQSSVGLGQTLAEQWNGTAWSIVSTPNTSSSQSNELNGVSCDSSSDCWAVGFGDVVAGVPQTLAEHGTMSATPTIKQQCMNGGWRTLTDASGQPFRNQGQCIAFAIHPPISLADLANSSFTGTQTFAAVNGCPFTYQTFDAIYPGSAAVGNVSLHVAGCVNAFPPSQYAGSFTITTGVGTLSGSASGSVALQLPNVALQITLSVNAGTGSFTGTTGGLLFSTMAPLITQPSFVGSVTVP